MDGSPAPRRRWTTWPTFTCLTSFGLTTSASRTGPD